MGNRLLAFLAAEEAFSIVPISSWIAVILPPLTLNVTPHGII